MSGVFVSHASADRALVDPFVDTVIKLGCEVPKDSIFYSSGEDTGVPSGYTLNGYVRSKLEHVSLVVAVISPTFQTRPFCVAELGAAWSQVGKLFPIAVPGLERTDMQGVLTGLIVRYLSDSAALDELHDLLCAVLGVNPGARTWGRYKAQFLANINEYVQQLPSVRVVTPEDHDRVTADLEGTREALRDAQNLIRDLKIKMDRLASAKSGKDIAEIMLPEGEHERFDVLVKKTKNALNEMPIVVREAMWFKFVNRDMPWQGPFEGKPDMDDAHNKGWLRDGFDNGVVPNDDFAEVRAASEAVEQLNDFLRRGNLSEAFNEWFRAKYHVSPDLRLKRVWDELF